jgi:hypothetical protein
MSGLSIPTTYEAPPRLLRILLATASAGALVFLCGTMIAPERVWGGYLMGFIYFVGLALAGPLFLSILYLSDARWGRPLRRVPEAMSAALPVSFVLGLGLIMGTHALYEWSHEQVVAEDSLLLHKAPWLNVTGFSIRLVAYFAVWIWIGRKVAWRSSAQGTSLVRRRTDIRVSAAFMAALAFTFSLASLDWVQSLDPHWFSTMFALRTLSGVACAGLALCTILLVVLRRQGPLRDVVTRDVMDDLGKILLALSLFWAYIWYCEYMIIWYSDIPEETGYYLLRSRGGWETLVPVNLVVNFAIPFLALMLRSWRRNGVVLMRIAGVVLIGHALDLYIMIAPPIVGSELRLGLWELGPVIGAVALFGWILLRALSRRALVPAE